MLFPSPEFLFIFLPITLVVFFVLARLLPHMVAASWLTLSSLVFYGWWNPRYVILLLFSTVFNYSVGQAILRARERSPDLSRLLLIVGLAGDLGLLGYYKYANFFVSSIEPLVGAGWQLAPIILPLGISFFTFTQIAFLVDTYRGEVKETAPVFYALFVTYFPHLIAGPILHHKQMIPQFAAQSMYRPTMENFAVGTTILLIGLFKKLVLADNAAPFAISTFGAAEAGVSLSFAEAWLGALAYTFQLYFDFSGYSDMAIGISRAFGVQLPINFDSPYKSTDIISFWRSWHMTLSAFLRDYLYVPLGGSRRGQPRRYANLMTTMLLGGLWHGAGWTFVIWGGLHGLFLMVNHAWRYAAGRLGFNTGLMGWRLIAWLLTFVAVVFAWVYFRASSLASANSIIMSMMQPHDFAVRPKLISQSAARGSDRRCAGGCCFLVAKYTAVSLSISSRL